MNWLFDTCVVSEMIRPRPSPRVMRWIENAHEESSFISALTLGEILQGLELMGDVHRAQKIRVWIETVVMARFEGRILPVDEKVATVWARLCAECKKKGVPRSVADSLLAATARVHGLTVATRNVSDFLYTGVSVVNPWEEEEF